MKTGKWFIKPVLPVTIFAKFGRILTALQHESTVCFILQLIKQKKVFVSLKKCHCNKIVRLRAFAKSCQRICLWLFRTKKYVSASE